MASYKKDASAAQNAKLRKLTRDYGAANAKMFKPAEVDAVKENSPSVVPGFDADGAPPKARLDRKGRSPAAANPVPTYAAGGGIPGMEDPAPKPKGKGSTQVNIVIMPGKGGQEASPSPLALPPVPPPSAPPGPPPGAGAAPGGPPGGLPPGMLAPGGMPPGMIPPRKRGGRVNHSDENADRALINKVLAEKGVSPKRAQGGAIPKVGLTAGAGSGAGRLQEAKSMKRRGL